MGGLGEAAGHEGDHGPQDHGFVAGGLLSWNAAYKDEPGKGAPAVEVSVWVPKAVVRAGIGEIASYLKTGLGWKVHRNGGWSGGSLMLGPDELTIVTVKVRAREIRTALRQEEDQLS